MNYTRKTKVIQQENLWSLNIKHSSEWLWHSYMAILNKFSPKENDEHRISIMKILFHLYYKQLFLVALLKLISSMFLFANPIILDWIIEFLNPLNQEPHWKGIFYAILMFLSPMLESMFNNQHEYYLNLITMQMKTSIMTHIYSKSLRLSNTTRQQFTTGEIVNLTSVDALRIVDLVNNINMLWSAPLQIAIGVYLLWLQLSYAAFAGFSFMLLVVPINVALTNKIRLFQLNLMEKKDSRSKLMNEILNAIKMIKLNSWERHFQTKIFEYRALELKQLKYIAIFQTFMVMFFSSSGVFVSLLCFIAYTLIESEKILDANKAFVSLALFNTIRK